MAPSCAGMRSVDPTFSGAKTNEIGEPGWISRRRELEQNAYAHGAERNHFGGRSRYCSRGSRTPKPKAARLNIRRIEMSSCVLSPQTRTRPANGEKTAKWRFQVALDSSCNLKSKRVAVVRLTSLVGRPALRSNGWPACLPAIRGGRRPSARRGWKPGFWPGLAARPMTAPLTGAAASWRRRWGSVT